MKTKTIFITIFFVLLFHFLTIAQQEEVRIEPNTKITIETGTTMDITTGNLVLESVATGDVSLIVLGAVEINNSGKTNAERYLPGSAQAWHMLGAPVSGMVISASVFAPGSSDDFYAWYEPSPGTWVNYKVTSGDLFFAQPSVNNGDNFLPGKGYLIAYNEANPTKTISGTINTGNVIFILKNSAKKDWSYTTGLNLMSNPYSSAIDWHLASRSVFYDDFAYAYNNAANDGAGAYEAIDGSSTGAYIASNQGFFVIVKTETANNTNFTFTNALQTHVGGTYLKNTTIEDKLVLRLTGNEYYDETKIRLLDESTFDRDRVDAIKMNSFNINAPNIYTISKDDINLAVNSIPEANVENSIPVGVVIPISGTYTINVQANNFSSSILYLEDKVTNKLHKIIDEDYEFTSPQGDINNRFVLHFGITGINNNDKPEMLNIWVYNKQLNIISETKQARLEIFDMQGRLMSSKTININGKYSEMLNLRSGVYVVRLQNSNMVKSKQITIK